MAVPLVLLGFFLAFVGASAVAARMRDGTKWIPHVVLAGIAFVLFFELMRYDQGHPEVLYYVGFLLAPVIAIFGGAAWGSRRLYGWPDLGPSPSRAALVAAAVLVSVLVGLDRKPQDIRTTEETLKAWVQRGAVGTPPASALGFIAPPPPSKGVDASGAEVWGFPIGNDRWRLLSVKTLTWSDSKIAPRRSDS